MVLKMTTKVIVRIMMQEIMTMLIMTIDHGYFWSPRPHDIFQE